MEYIKISKTLSLYKKITFAVKAIDKDIDSSGRYLLHLLCVKNNHIYCTDGHRVHIVELNKSDNIPVGLYEVVRTQRNIFYLLNVNEDMKKFPNINSIIPDIKSENILVNSPRLIGDLDISKLLGEIYKKGVAINYKFIEDMKNVNDGCWDVYVYSEFKPVLFINLPYRAVLMPFRNAFNK